jgi:bacteriocin-like protein
MAKPNLKPEDLAKIEEVTEEDLKEISGGKSVMPAAQLRTYTLLKISTTELAPVLKDTMQK